MDRKLQADILALVLLLAAFPITSWGAVQGMAVVWWIGLILLVVGGLVPVVTRFMDHSTDKIRDVGPEFDERPS